MKFGVIGTSYRTAALQVRERFAIAEADLEAVLAQVRALPGIDEAMVVSTCNRVEFYVVASSVADAEQNIKAYIARRQQLSQDELQQALYCVWNGDALKHIFRVASSLDAMVVGEAQIMGQVKEAFSVAVQCGSAGPLLSRCMQRAFFVAKRVRTETEIARHPASISSVAVDLAGRIFANLSDLAVLVVGAGEMAELAVTHLVAQGATRIRVANRSLERAQQLAGRLSGEAVPLETLEHQLEWADMVITSTGSADPIMDRALLSQVMRHRKHRSMLIVDIAVPRDVDPKARSVSNLYLFDVDDLEQALAANLQARRREAKTAEKMVIAEVEGFGDWMRHQDVVPLIKQLRAQFSTVARGEVLRAGKRLQLETEEQQEGLERLANAIVNKLLHAPTAELKRYAAAPNGTALTDATRKLFQLGDAEVMEGGADEGEVVGVTQAAASATTEEPS